LVSDDDLVFAPEDEAADAQRAVSAPKRAPPWKVLVVDDEEEIRGVTRLVLRDFSFRSRDLQLINAYSAQQAKSQLQAHPDIAVAFLDVVMETDSAGLDLARYIRETLKNRTIRIVLRTGQPGHAPEHRVIVDYDNNDYKEKSELTAQKLFSTMVTALRSYQDTVTIETARRALEKIIRSASALFQKHSMEGLLSGVLLQLGSLLEVGIDGVLVSATRRDSQVSPSTSDMQVVAATGRFQGTLGKNAGQSLEAKVWQLVEKVLDMRESVYQSGFSIVYFDSQQKRDTVLYLETMRDHYEIDRTLMELFCSQASLGIEYFHKAS
jgi:CheY-like chemotaxis protein